MSKDRIPDKLKNDIWNKYSIYPYYPQITQCCTCENLVMIPVSIRKYHNLTYDILNIYVDRKKKKISGTAEFGHIISEKNGGKISIDNLIIQCKSCNTYQGSKNIDKNCLNNTDIVMIDQNQIDEPFDIEMGIKEESCTYILNNGNKCNNKTIFNRNLCHIHLNS